MNPLYPEVSRRAGRRCEYCRAPEDIANCEFEVDHIVPVSRGGPDVLSNLALACRACNLRKRQCMEQQDEVSGEVARLFNPRTDRWDDHFRFEPDSATIEPLTANGRVTVAILDLNHPRQIVARLVWIAHRFYP